MDGKYQPMPPLTDEEYDELKDSIANNSIDVAIEYDENGEILDGHHRVKAWQELRDEGVDVPDYPRIVKEGLSEAQKVAYARRVNLVRRQLTRIQKRQLIASQMTEAPEVSDRQMSSTLDVDHKTVGAVRGELEQRGEIPHVSTTIDTLGRRQPRPRPSHGKSTSTYEDYSNSILSDLNLGQVKSAARERQLQSAILPPVGAAIRP